MRGAMAAAHRHELAGLIAEAFNIPPLNDGGGTAVGRDALSFQVSSLLDSCGDNTDDARAQLELMAARKPLHLLPSQPLPTATATEAENNATTRYPPLEETLRDDAAMDDVSLFSLHDLETLRREAMEEGGRIYYAGGVAPSPPKKAQPAAGSGDTAPSTATHAEQPFFRQKVVPRHKGAFVVVDDQPLISSRPHSLICRAVFEQQPLKATAATGSSARGSSTVVCMWNCAVCGSLNRVGAKSWPAAMRRKVEQCEVPQELTPFFKCRLCDSRPMTQ